MRYMPLQAMWTTPKGRRVCMDFRDQTNDWNTITSALQHDEYGLRDFDIRGIAWDIGAHIGAVTVGLLADNADLRVVAVEPVEQNANLIWGNCWHNGLADRATIVRAAAGPPGMTETILHSGFRGSEIALHHAFIGTTETGNDATADNWREATDHDRITVPAVDFDGLVALGGGMPAFIKIDCEGAEYAFLQAPGTAQVPLILGEWHNIPFTGRERSAQTDVVALLPNHSVTFSGPEDGPGGFVAVRK